MQRQAINMIAFQLCWLACILGGARNKGWYAPLALSVVVTIHLLLAREKQREAELILACGAFGTFADTLMMDGGLIAFPNGSWASVICPFWMTALWLGFATLLNVSLTWLRGRFLLAAILGLLAGPLSYYAGIRLGALELHPNKALGLAAIGIEWAVAMPILLLLAARAASRRPGLTQTAEAAAP